MADEIVIVRGKPIKTIEQRFFDRIERIPECGCWLWMGSVSKRGYGKIGIYHAGSVDVHRFSYELHHGRVPENLELDHICRVRCCVNPNHLEPVTHLENVRRGAAGLNTGAKQRAKTHCPKGHQYSGENLYRYPDGRRRCRECNRTSDRERKAAARLGGFSIKEGACAL